MYGEQEQSAYNGYFESVCNHPLFLFDRQGDCLAAKLRPGNVHGAEGWEEVLLPDIERQQVEELLTRPVGRQSHRPVVRYRGFPYRAASWSTAPRVMAKFEFHAAELFSRVGLIVTNLELPSRAVVRFYNRWSTAEQWIKEGKLAVNWTLWRRLALPKKVGSWSPTSLQQRLVKTGGRLAKHARYY